MDRLRLTADDDSVDSVVALVRETCLQRGVGADDIAILELVCDELVSNIRRYAYGDENREFEFGIGFDDATCVLRFVDTGPPFDLTEKRPPDTGAPPEDRQIGGLGIFLVREYADRVDYERRGDRNVVTVRRRVLPSTA